MISIAVVDDEPMVRENECLHISFQAGYGVNNIY